jgi:hypothetical protein
MKPEAVIKAIEECKTAERREMLATVNEAIQDMLNGECSAVDALYSVKHVISGMLGADKIELSAIKTESFFVQSPITGREM